MNKIAKIIASSNGGKDTPWGGGYYKEKEGNVVFTDRYRILIIDSGEKISKNVFINQDGEEVDEKFPNYGRYLNGNYDITGEFDVDLGNIIIEHDLLKTKNKHVAFVTDDNGTEKILNVFNNKFITDLLKIYRSYHHNRTKNMKVKMTFQSDGDLNAHCKLEVDGGKMIYLLMPFIITPNTTLSKNVTKIKI